MTLSGSALTRWAFGLAAALIVAGARPRGSRPRRAGSATRTPPPGSSRRCRPRARRRWSMQVWKSAWRRAGTPIGAIQVTPDSRLRSIGRDRPTSPARVTECATTPEATAMPASTIIQQRRWALHGQIALHRSLPRPRPRTSAARVAGFSAVRQAACEDCYLLVVGSRAWT